MNDVGSQDAARKARRRGLLTVLAIGALLSLLLVIRIEPRTVWLHVALDASHGPIFAGVAFLLALTPWPSSRRAATESWPQRARYATVLLLCIVLGALIEFLQGFEGRPPSLFDVMTDTAGALIGLGAWALTRVPASTTREDLPRRRVLAVIALALVGAAFILWRPVHAALAYAHRSTIFPTIVEFKQPIDLYFTTRGGAFARLDRMPAVWSRRPAESALALGYAPGHPPNVQVIEPDGDWRGYGVISVDLTNAAPSGLRLTLRILDAHHDWSHADRMNLPLLIPPRTRTTIRVSLGVVAGAPATRRMDMSQIANVMLFANDPPVSGVLYVSRIWLE